MRTVIKYTLHKYNTHVGEASLYYFGKKIEEKQKVIELTSRSVLAVEASLRYSIALCWSSWLELRDWVSEPSTWEGGHRV